MNSAAQFLDLVHRAAPEHAQLIDARAALLGNEPLRLLNDLVERQVAERSRLYQLWADALGVAYVSPITVAIPTEAQEQLPVDIARRVLAVTHRRSMPGARPRPQET